MPVYLIDVRPTVVEHDTAALSDSVLMPLGELQSRLQELKPPEGLAWS